MSTSLGNNTSGNIDLEELEKTQVTKSIPRYVPFVNMLSQPPEDDADLVPACAGKVEGVSCIKYIKQITCCEKIMDDFTAYFYQLRSVTRDLEKHVKASAKTDKRVAEIAEPILKNLVQPLIDFNSQTTTSIELIKGILNNPNIWNKGSYSEELIDHIFSLIYKMECISQLNPTRKAVADDISKIMKIAGISAENQLFPVALRFWFNTPSSVRKDLITALTNAMEPELVQKVLTIFYARISYQLTDQKFIIADQETIYIVALTFCMDLCTQAQNREKASKASEKKPKYVIQDVPMQMCTLLLQFRAKHPALLLIYEFPLDFDEFLTYSTFLRDINSKQQKNGVTAKARFHVDLKSIMEELRDELDSLVAHNAHLTDDISEQTVEYYINELPIALKKLNNAIHTLRELFADKILNVTIVKTGEGQTDEIMSSYERAMKFDFSDQERELTMQILAICRSTREVIYSNLPKLNEIISNHINKSIQEFVVNKLEYSLFKYSKKQGFERAEIENIRTLLGYFTSDEEMKVRTDKSEINKKPHEIHQIATKPHTSLIQLLRVQLQRFVNPDSSMQQKSSIFSSKILDDSDIDEFKNFLNKSVFYIDLCNLEQMLVLATDQSALFFKEYHLDVYRTAVSDKVSGAVIFPVTTSLPYILIDYAIKHPTKMELVGSIFYPLSIYDDASSTALKVMKSQYSFDEIRAESEICLMQITKTICEFAFQQVKNYAMQCFTDQFNPNLINEPTTLDPSALRFPSVLQQDQLFLLGNYINIKQLFATRLTELFMESIKAAFAPIKQYGILAIMLFTKTKTILKTAHQIFLDFKIPLTEFDGMVSQTISANTPNSFQNTLLQYCTANIVDIVAPSFILHTNPYRLVPPPEIDLTEYIRKNKQTFSPLLRQTTSFITVEHFRELVSLLDDGAVYCLANSITEAAEQQFNYFLECYQIMQPNIRRIQDVPIGTGSHRVYDMFEGAYRGFINNELFQQLLDSMRCVGNIIAIAEMLDIAYSLKRNKSQQVLAYIYGSEHKDIDAKFDDFFNLFDDRFKAIKQFFEGAETSPFEDEIAQPFMQSVIEKIARMYISKADLFNESSQNVFDFPSLSGFAAVWSVLEFVFCLREVHRKEEQDTIKGSKTGSFAAFGEGVFLSAATLICITRQRSLYNILSIGERIIQQNVTDIAVLDDETMSRFLAVYQLVQVSLNYSFMSVQPSVEAIIGSKD